MHMRCGFVFRERCKEQGKGIHEIIRIGVSDYEAERERHDDYILMTNLQEPQHFELPEFSQSTYVESQHDSNIITSTPDMHLARGEVKQHTLTNEETNAFFESMLQYIKVELDKCVMVNRDSNAKITRLITELARYKGNKEVCADSALKKEIAMAIENEEGDKHDPNSFPKRVVVSKITPKAPITSFVVDNENGVVVVTSRKKKKKIGPNRVSGVNLSKCNLNLKYQSGSQTRKGNGEALKVDTGPMKCSLQDNGSGNTYVDEVVSIKNSFGNDMGGKYGTTVVNENVMSQPQESLWEKFKEGKVASSSKSKITSLDDDSDDDEEVYMPDSMASGGSMYGLEDDLDCYNDYWTQVYDLTPQEKAFCDQYDIFLNSHGRK
ncbi:hypothetical protein Tco_0890623 [Tanacetum coccineum]|uniref:Uncharacterized protein n=1 Tax=Tanacetum coccineum TaxID=301880 RepID=A0ABQ5C3Y3_9ASTR